MKLNRTILESQGCESAAMLVDEAILSLTERQRDAVVLHHLCGLSLERTALELDCRRHVLRARIARGIANIGLFLMKRGIFMTDGAVCDLLKEPSEAEVSEAFLDEILEVCLGRKEAPEHALHLAGMRTPNG